MDIESLDILVYSSHKTGTQTLVDTLNTGGLNTKHCHYLSHLEMDKEKFKELLGHYKNKNDKKLKIITVIRNPKNRLISSFFQSFHDDPINFGWKNEFGTIIAISNVDELAGLYKYLILNALIPILQN